MARKPPTPKARRGASGDFEMHPLYQASFALTVWIDQLFDELGDLQNHPSAVKLATQSAIASAKLAAALSDDDIDEIGMTIAYLKRALKAITNAMEAAVRFGARSPSPRTGLPPSTTASSRSGWRSSPSWASTARQWRRRYGDAEPARFP